MAKRALEDPVLVEASVSKRAGSSQEPQDESRAGQCPAAAAGRRENEAECSPREPEYDTLYDVNLHGSPLATKPVFPGKQLSCAICSCFTCWVLPCLYAVTPAPLSHTGFFRALARTSSFLCTALWSGARLLLVFFPGED